MNVVRSVLNYVSINDDLWLDSFDSRSKIMYTEEFKMHPKSWRITESLKLEGTSGDCLV